MPPFRLTAEQRAELDALKTNESKTALLQTLHQVHAYKHRQIVGAWGSLDPAQFTCTWNANMAENMSEAWAEYLGDPLPSAAESYVPARAA